MRVGRSFERLHSARRSPHHLPPRRPLHESHRPRQGPGHHHPQGDEITQRRHRHGAGACAGNIAITLAQGPLSCTKGMKTRNLFKAARLPAGYWILALACPQLLIAILLLPSAVAAGGCSPQQRSVLAGEGWSGLALKSNGTVWAWGYNPYGG